LSAKGTTGIVSRFARHYRDRGIRDAKLFVELFFGREYLKERERCFERVLKVACSKLSEINMVFFFLTLRRCLRDYKQTINKP